MESPFFQSHSSFHMPFCLLPFMFYLFLSTFCHLPFIFYLFTFYLLNFTFYILPCTLSPGPWTLYLVPFALYRIPSKLSKIILPTVRIMRISNVITNKYICPDCGHNKSLLELKLWSTYWHTQLFHQL